MSSPAVQKLTDAQAISLQQASEYDHIILIDASGSMDSPSTTMKGATRWKEAQEFAEQYARFAEKADEDGITVITFASSPTIYDGVKADKVHEIFTSQKPSGTTNLTDAMEAAFKKKFASGKKAFITVVTDGEPNDTQGVKDSIINATKKLSRDEEIGIQFIQVGDDAGARRFLEDLDDNLKGAKFDIVNSLTRAEAEAYTIEQLLWLSLND